MVKRHFKIEAKIELFCFYMQCQFQKVIALFCPPGLPVPIPESSIGVTFGVTGVLSDVVNEI